MSKNGFLNFLTLFLTQFQLLSENISFLVMINMVSVGTRFLRPKEGVGLVCKRP